MTDSDAKTALTIELDRLDEELDGQRAQIVQPIQPGDITACGYDWAITWQVGKALLLILVGIFCFVLLPWCLYGVTFHTVSTEPAMVSTINSSGVYVQIQTCNGTLSSCHLEEYLALKDGYSSYSLYCPHIFLFRYHTVPTIGKYLNICSTHTSRRDHVVVYGCAQSFMNSYVSTIVFEIVINTLFGILMIIAGIGVLAFFGVIGLILWWCAYGTD